MKYVRFLIAIPCAFVVQYLSVFILAFIFKLLGWVANFNSVDFYGFKGEQNYLEQIVVMFIVNGIGTVLFFITGLGIINREKEVEKKEEDDNKVFKENGLSIALIIIFIVVSFLFAYFSFLDDETLKGIVNIFNGLIPIAFMGWLLKNKNN